MKKTKMTVFIESELETESESYLKLNNCNFVLNHGL